MLKLILLLVVGYFIYRLFANDWKKKKAERKKKESEEQARMASEGLMAQDPECGVYVSVDDSISVREGKKVYYFCSYECRDKYLKKLEASQTSIPEDK